MTISPPHPGRVVTEKTEATFKIKSSKLYIPVVTLSINGDIKFLEHLKKGFKRTISWKLNRSEVTIQPKKSNFDYMVCLLCSFIKKLWQ